MPKVSRAHVEEPRIAQTAGLNLIASPDALPNEAFPDLGNVRVTAGGRVETRLGAISIYMPNATQAWAGASTNFMEAYAVEDIGYAVANPGSASQIVCIGGMILRTVSSANGTEDVTYQFPVYYNASTLRLRRPYGINFTDSTPTKYVVLVFGEVAPLAIQPNNTTTTIAHADWTGANGYPQVVASYGGRVWYAASKAFPNRIWATDTGSVGTFTVSNPPVASESFVLDLDLVDGGRIIGMQHLFDILLVFTTHGIYRISPDNTGNIPYRATFVSTHSCLSQHAIIKVDNAVVFLTPSGVYSAVAALTYGDIQFAELSPQIAPVFDTLYAWQLAGAFMAYDSVRSRILLFLDHNYSFARASALSPLYTFVTAQTDLQSVGFAYAPATTECFVYDIRGKSWTRDYFPFHVRYATERAEANAQRVLDSYDFTVNAGVSYTLVERHLEQSTLVDAGSPLASYVRSKEETFGSLALRKHHVFLECDVLAGAPVLTSAFDRGAFSGASTLAAGRNRVLLLGSGHRVQVDWFSSSTPFTLGGYSFALGVGGRR